MSTSSLPEFDPALTGSAENGIYGIATTIEHSALVYLPVPWEVTTSYGGGTSQGPAAILKASPQLDLYLRDTASHYRRGFHLLEANGEIVALNSKYKPVAEAIQLALETTGELNPALIAAQRDVNAASERINELVYQQSRELDRAGKQLGLIGGDHSSPYGLIRYLGEKYNGDFGILHVDAHLDLRDSYQGFRFSHASIMRNVLALGSAPRALVQIGIRDFCEEECHLARSDPRVSVFYDEDIKARLFQGESFAGIVDQVMAALPGNVYISFDIDGLKPNLCPHTGTPVPGGLDFEQALFLIKAVAGAGKRIVGFDLCEVCPNPANPDDEWDGNVGARILFLLSSWMMESRATD